MDRTATVPKGYKQTEVGVIPGDWIVVSVGQLIRDGIIEKPLDGNHGNIHPKSGDFVSFGIPFIMANNVHGGRVDMSNCAFIRKKQADSLRKGFSITGDVLLTHKATIGNTAIVGEIPFEYIMLTPQVTYYRVSNQKRLSNFYLRHYFDGDLFQNELYSKSGGGTRAYIGVSAQHQLPIILPPTKAEQEAIAEALSDADALIESLEQLIAKKRLIKQGAMQELLSGKRRLPGFEVNRGYKQAEAGVIPEDWDLPELGNIVESMQLGGNYKNSASESSWPLIKMGNLGRGNIRLEKLEYIDRDHPPDTRDRLKSDDLLLNTRNTLELVGKVAIWRNELAEAYFNSNIMRMEFDKEKVSSKYFMNNSLNTPQMLKSLRGIAIGTTSVAAIYGRDLIKIRIPLPGKAEQEAIATILRDMDAEIASFEVKLNKARQIKQGMMQELLTGRIRLV